MKSFSVLIFVLFSVSLFSEDKSSWTFYESDDVIDGYWSVVTGTDLLGRELAFYGDGRLVVRNGDGYICADAYGDYNKLKVIFKIDEEEHFYQKFGISDDRSVLVYKEEYIKGGMQIERKDYTKYLIKKSWGNRGLDLKKFVNKLKPSGELFIRTQDGCGNVVSMLFDLKGFTKAISNIYEWRLALLRANLFESLKDLGTV